MALLFDGTNDVVSFGDIDSLDTPTAFTISFWVSVDEAGAAANDGYLGKGVNAATHGFSTLANNGGFGFRFFIGATAYNKTTMFADTAFQMLSVVYDGSGAANADRLKVYLNAVEQTATSFTGTIPATCVDSAAAPLNFGRASSDLGFMAMTAAHLKIWTAALTQGELLQELYSHSPRRFSNLLIWAPFDNGVATDYSGNGLTGAITEAVEAASPAQVLYGNAVIAPTRNQRGTRRSNLQGFRRLGPHVPLITRGV